MNILKKLLVAAFILSSLGAQALEKVNMEATNDLNKVSAYFSRITNNTNNTLYIENEVAPKSKQIITIKPGQTLQNVPIDFERVSYYKVASLLIKNQNKPGYASVLGTIGLKVTSRWEATSYFSPAYDPNYQGPFPALDSDTYSVNFNRYTEEGIKTRKGIGLPNKYETLTELYKKINLANENEITLNLILDLNGNYLEGSKLEVEIE